MCVRVCLHLSSVVYQDGFYGADIYVSIRMPSLNAHVHDPPPHSSPSDRKSIDSSWFLLLALLNFFLITSRDPRAPLETFFREYKSEALLGAF